MELDLEEYVPSFELLEALSDALLLRASDRPGPPCLKGFWSIPWLEADDTHKALTQVVSADFCEIVVSYAVFAEDRKGALPWKALMAMAADLSREVAGLKRSPPTPEVAAVLLIYRQRLETLYFARRSCEEEVCAPSTPPSKTSRFGSPVSARRIKSYLDLFEDNGHPSPIRPGADSPQTCRYKRWVFGQPAFAEGGTGSPDLGVGKASTEAIPESVGVLARETQLSQDCVGDAGSFSMDVEDDSMNLVRY